MTAKAAETQQTETQQTETQQTETQQTETQQTETQQTETQQIGILAYGSLISDPGSEIECAMIEHDGYMVGVYTPFSVEFARKSSTRGNAPTLVPINDCKGKKVRGQVFIMNWPKDGAERLRNILYYRERNMVGKNREICKDTNNDNVVGSIDYNVREVENKIKGFIDQVKKNIKEGKKTQVEIKFL